LVTKPEGSTLLVECGAVPFPYGAVVGGIGMTVIVLGTVTALDSVGATPESEVGKAPIASVEVVIAPPSLPPSTVGFEAAAVSVCTEFSTYGEL
jgi:hypothetical protein